MKVIAAILFVLCIAFPAAAASPIIDSCSGQAKYEENYTFTLNAHDADGDIIEAYVEYWWGDDTVRIRKPLYYDQERGSIAERVVINAQQTWQPPGSLLRYQWMVKDQQGNITYGPEEVIIYSDNRYSWQEIESEHFIVYYYEDRAVADMVSEVAEETYPKVAQDIGYGADEKIKIYIYATKEAYLEVGDASLRDWAGGSSYAQHNLFLMPASKDEVWLKQLIPHEVTHILFNRRVGDYSVLLPIWLQEGIAMYEEDYDYSWEENGATVKRALKDGKLIPLTQMRDFSFRESDEVGLIYAESYTVIKYMVETYGVESFNALIERLSEGKDFDEALRDVYGLGLEELDIQWQNYLKTEALDKDMINLIPLSSNFIFLALLAFLLIGVVAARKIRKCRSLSEDEESGIDV